MKKRVVFYLLNQQNNSPFLFACRLLEKAFKQGSRVLVQTNNSKESDEFNHLLWTFKDISFIPHHLYNDTFDSPIMISHVAVTTNDREILVNLTDSVPTTFQNFSHIVEIVGTTVDAKNKSREKYRFYREQNLELETHNM